ncbi:guanylate kinase [bacterium]|nr:MAG: guanylate kinase [bacterium]
MQGKLVVLSGPSGVGKDTVLDAWRERNGRVERVVTYTTRTPRPGEVHGVDYVFVTRERFFEHAESGDFLEHKEVHGNHYASPLCDTEEMLRQGKIAVLKIDVQGALAVMPLRPDALTVFLLPPNGNELARRIRERGTETNDEVIRRLRNAEGEMALAGAYAHRIVNDDVERTVDQLEALAR